MTKREVFAFFLEKVREFSTGKVPIFFLKLVTYHEGLFSNIKHEKTHIVSSRF